MAERYTEAAERRATSPIWLFPAALFYYELVFRLFTAGHIFRWGTLLSLGYCCAWGGICHVLCTLSRSPRRNRRAAIILLVLAAIPYGVEDFLYWQFQVYYSLNTIVNGAGDMLTGFTGDMFRLIFSSGGLLRLVLYLAPGVGYGLLSARPGPARIDGRRRAMALVKAMAVLVICRLVVGMSPELSLVHGERYTFPAAVEQFGLLTGVGLDARESLFGRATFQAVDAPAAATASPAPEQTPAPEYAPNMLALPLDDANAGSAIQDVNRYVASLQPSKQNAFTGLFKGKNLIFITAEAFSPYCIDADLTPTLYRLATKGVQFTDYYQPAGAGTTGGEYQNLFGLLPVDGGGSFSELVEDTGAVTIAGYLTQEGYYGKAFHNNTYTYYDRNVTHKRLGYSDGFMGYGNGMEAYVQDQWPQSDDEMISGTLPTYVDRQPFSVYYMTVSGHNGYTYLTNAMTRKHWNEVLDLPCSDTIKGYLAANLDLEAAMGHLVEQLEQRGIADDTVICLTADHFPYGLDGGAGLGAQPYLEELYGCEVNNEFDRDRSCWILWCGSLEEQDPIVVDEPTSSLDILPTLCNLFGVSFDSRLMPGRDVFSDTEALVFDWYSWKTAYGYYISSEQQFYPTVDEASLPAGYVENMTTVVANKVNYCKAVLDTNYYHYLFGQ